MMQIKHGLKMDDLIGPNWEQVDDLPMFVKVRELTRQERFWRWLRGWHLGVTDKSS